MRESIKVYHAARLATRTPTCGNPEADAIGSQQFTADDSARAYPALTVLTNNSDYRVSDIVVHGGKRWRRDSIRVLTRPRYRDSALHELLMTTSTVDGVPLVRLRPRVLAGVLRRAALRDRALRGRDAAERAGGIRCAAHASRE